VVAAASDTIGTTRLATPSDRMKGTGTSSIDASPMAKAIPDTTTVRPALAIVSASAVVGSTAGSCSCARKRCTMSSE
jgi:hypothetical protein